MNAEQKIRLHKAREMVAHARRWYQRGWAGGIMGMIVSGLGIGLNDEPVMWVGGTLIFAGGAFIFYAYLLLDRAERVLDGKTP